MSRNTLILEQIHAGDVDKSVYGEADVSEKLKELADSDKEILTKYPTEKMKFLVAEKLAKSLSENVFEDSVENSSNRVGEKSIPVNPIFRNYLKIHKIVGIAAVLCLVLVLPILVSRMSSNYEGITLEESIIQNSLPASERAKGSSSIFLYKKNNDAIMRLKNEAIATEGDCIQITYIAAGAKYGSIISIDGNGYLSQHYPEYGNKAYELDNGGEIPLDYAYQLDDAPDFERFLFITSDSSFDIRKLIKAVENIKNPMDCKTMDFSEYLPNDVNIKEVLLIKK